MDFSHYSDQPAELAVALVNTRQLDHDQIADMEQLEGFLDRWKDLWVGVGRPPSPKELRGIHRLRDSLREVFKSPDDEVAAERINQILASHGAVPRVSAHNGEPHFHFEPLGSSMLSWLGATTSMGLANVVVDHGVERFGVCGARECEDVFIDNSRNRSRRNCSTTCSTREAVAAYRARQSN